jgi:hypothetical protein
MFLPFAHPPSFLLAFDPDETTPADEIDSLLPHLWKPEIK